MARSRNLSELKTVDERDDRVLLRKGESYAIAKKPSGQLVDPLAAVLLLFESYCPLAPATVKRAPSLMSRRYHIKSPQLEKAAWDEDWGLDELKAKTLREISICETLRQTLHPNIVAYQGCIIKHGLITGICYTIYDETLQDRLNPSGVAKRDFQYGQAERPLQSREKVVEGVKQGLLFLHSLGLVHNDIKPDNIMLTASERPIVVDFDTCVPYGRSLKRVARPIGWHDPKNHYALYSNDLDALDEVEKWMSDKKVKDYRFGNDDCFQRI